MERRAFVVTDFAKIFSYQYHSSSGQSNIVTVLSLVKSGNALATGPGERSRFSSTSGPWGCWNGRWALNALLYEAATWREICVCVGVLLVFAWSYEFDKRFNSEIIERPSDNTEIPEVKCQRSNVKSDGGWWSISINQYICRDTKYHLMIIVPLVCRPNWICQLTYLVTRFRPITLQVF